MRNLTLLALVATLALSAPLSASAEETSGVQIDTAVTKQAVADHLNATVQTLNDASASDATGVRLIAAARKAYDMAVKSWNNDDYVPAADYVAASDTLLAAKDAAGRGTSDEAYDATGAVVSNLSPCSANWLSSFATELYSRAMRDRSSDPQTAALELVRAGFVAHATQLATAARSGAAVDEAPTHPGF